MAAGLTAELPMLWKGELAQRFCIGGDWDGVKL
jgi:hypothetical protein